MAGSIDQAKLRIQKEPPAPWGIAWFFAGYLLRYWQNKREARKRI